MTVQQLTQQYEEIGILLNEKWPIDDKNKRIFARTMKIVEEFGELADEILTSMNLQRNTKIENFSRLNVEDEFADVLGSLILLAIELDIDVETVMKRKIELTRKRFGK
ncbi:MAG: MazG nucleotide pyrophosphohydrolase domain-containing protein [Patescibacteria group bacterium]